MEKSSIGNRVQLLRKEAGLNQKQLAEIIGVNQNTLSRYETNDRQIQPADVVRLADYFGVSCDYLLRGYAPDNVKHGQETGLSDKTLDLLKQRHRERPDYDDFTEHLLSGKNYWNLNRYVRECIDTEKRLIINPDAVADILIGGTADNLQDSADFKKYKAVQCFQRILDDYIQKVMEDGSNP